MTKYFIVSLNKTYHQVTGRQLNVTEVLLNLTVNCNVHNYG